MKKITLIPLVIAVSFIAGCANDGTSTFRNHTENFLYDKAVRPVHNGTSWGHGNFRNQMADHVVNPKPHMANPRGKRHYSRYHNSNLPRYHVTADEQAKYHDLNDKLQNRMNSLRKQDVKSEANSHVSTVPTISPSNGATTQ